MKRFSTAELGVFEDIGKQSFTQIPGQSSRGSSFSFAGRFSFFFCARGKFSFVRRVFFFCAERLFLLAWKDLFFRAESFLLLRGKFYSFVRKVLFFRAEGFFYLVRKVFFFLADGFFFCAEGFLLLYGSFSSFARKHLFRLDCLYTMCSYALCYIHSSQYFRDDVALGR